MLDKHLLCVTGLPRAGSTLLCQLLAHHPLVYYPGHSSPLCPTLTTLRSQLSNNDFCLTQMDADFHLGYQRLLNAFRGFVNGWFAETDQDWVVDKNRAWLQHLELTLALDPNVRMLVCIRELGQVYGSIEAQHQKTLLLDFPDQLAHLSRADRFEQLLAPTGVVGAPLRSVQALQDLEDHMQQALYYVVFEQLVHDPLTVMQGIWDWLDLPSTPIDPHYLKGQPHASDSYYRFKYSHQSQAGVQPPPLHSLPARFQQHLEAQFAWYYDIFYPRLSQ